MPRFAVPAMLLLLAAACDEKTSPPPSADLAAPDLAPPQAGPVSYPSGAETVTGYLAPPSTTGKHPAVILVHEYWGLNDWVKTRARSLAGRGYVALAVDLFRGQVTEDPQVASQLAAGLPMDRARRDVQAAFAYLLTRADVDGARVGAVGWCMGGGFSVSGAVDLSKLAADVVYYGRLPTDAGDIAKIKAPILGNFGELDKGIPPAAVDAFAKQATAAGVTVDFKEYPGAGHGFASNPAALVPAAAADADARTDGWFAKYLKPEQH